MEKRKSYQMPNKQVIKNQSKQLVEMQKQRTHLIRKCQLRYNYEPERKGQWEGRKVPSRLKAEGRRCNPKPPDSKQIQNGRLQSDRVIPPATESQLA